MKNQPAEATTEPAEKPAAKPTCSHTGCNKPAAWAFDGKLYCTEHHNKAAEGYRRAQQTKVPAAGN